MYSKMILFQKVSNLFSGGEKELLSSLVEKQRLIAPYSVTQADIVDLIVFF
jgi:hypothetical protein